MGMAGGASRLRRPSVSNPSSRWRNPRFRGDGSLLEWAESLSVVEDFSSHHDASWVAELLALPHLATPNRAERLLTSDTLRSRSRVRQPRSGAGLSAVRCPTSNSPISYRWPRSAKASTLNCGHPVEPRPPAMALTVTSRSLRSASSSGSARHCRIRAIWRSWRGRSAGARNSRARQVLGRRRCSGPA